MTLCGICGVMERRRYDVEVREECVMCGGCGLDVTVGFGRRCDWRRIERVMCKHKSPHILRDCIEAWVLLRNDVVLCGAFEIVGCLV